jgi:hypothetical protein
MCSAHRPKQVPTPPPLAEPRLRVGGTAATDDSVRRSRVGRRALRTDVTGEGSSSITSDATASLKIGG